MAKRSGSVRGEVITKARLVEALVRGCDATYTPRAAVAEVKRLAGAIQGYGLSLKAEVVGDDYSGDAKADLSHAELLLAVAEALDDAVPSVASLADSARDKQVTAIAKRVLSIETLTTRNSDRLDFREVGVASVKDALVAAYEAGRNSEAR